MAFSKALKKTPVLVRVCEGFVANRMMGKYLQQAEFLLEEGATPWQVDKVVKDFGFPMGPFAMIDLAGIDVTVRIRSHWPKELRTHNPPHYRYSTIMEKLHAAGRLGQKTSKGFHLYQSGSFNAVQDPEVVKLLETHSKELDYKRRNISDKEVLDRMLLAAVQEGILILQEHIAERAGDIDVIWISWMVWRTNVLGRSICGTSESVGTNRTISKGIGKSMLESSSIVKRSCEER